LILEEFAKLDKAYDEILDNLAMLLSCALERELSLLAAEEEKRRFYRIAIVDPLTGLYNRFYLNTVAENEFYKAKRYEYSLSVIMFDVDHFKDINDRYGHLVGDLILKEVAGVIRESIRKGDIPIRYGGEEILVLLPFSRKNEAYAVAERIRRKIAEKEFTILNNGIKITISAGVAEFENETTLDELIRKADKKLYQAKQLGRNRVVK